MNQDVGVSDRGDLVIAMPDGDASDGVHNKIRFNSRQSSIQISGKGGADAGNGDTEHTDIYIATKTGVSAINTGFGAEVAGIIRFEDKGSNNNRYHGIELRNRNTGDVRILNLDEGTTNKGNLVFGVDNGSTLVEALRITSDAVLRGGSAASTSGSTLIENKYSDDDILVVIGSMYSTGNLSLGYGLRPKSGGSGYTSSFANFSGRRAALQIGQGTFEFHATAGSSSTAVGTDLGTTVRMKIDNSGHFLPGANDTYDLGSSSLRWRDVYTNDLNLSNEGGTHDVDGTWGNYTIQEGENDLYLINRRNGKKYKFNLTEVS